LQRRDRSRCNLGLTSIEVVMSAEIAERTHEGSHQRHIEHHRPLAISSTFAKEMIDLPG